MFLSCGCCNLRLWHRTDVSALVHHANNIAVARQLRDIFPHPYTHRDAEDWLQLVAHHPPEFGLCIEVNGQAVGCIGLKPGKDIERTSAEIGYWLGEPFWGKGIATAALIKLTRFALDELNITRLYAVPFARNTASRRVLEKAGYAFDCLMRKSAIKDNQIVDQALYSCVKE